MVLGEAPLCTLLDYDGGADSTEAGVYSKEADDNLADVLTESYGWDYGGDTGPPEACHTIHLQMSAQGQTYLCASGDDGTTDMEIGFDYPDADPDILNVGGTQASFDATGNRLAEPAWSGSGGGWTVTPYNFNTLPAYQVGKGIPTNIPYRLVPDVAFNAAGQNGAYWFYLAGALTNGYDGTSFASPMFAGVLADIEEQVYANGGLTNPPHRYGRINDLLYSQNQRPDAWFDVTEGATGTLPNGQLSVATVGWDFTSGWGCMIVAGFINAVSVSPVTVLPPTGASVFDNTYMSPATVEGSYVSGNAASLASGIPSDAYTVSPVGEVGLGQVATIEGTFTGVPGSSTIATLVLNFTGQSPTPLTVFIYLYNWTTGAYDLIKSMSGTQAERTTL